MQTRCEICGREASLHADHDHATGLIRGWLCGPCNRGLGFIERPEWMAKAAAYLARKERFGPYAELDREHHRRAYRKYHANLTEEQRERRLEYARAWRAANPERVAVYRERSNELRRRKRSVDPNYARGDRS